MSEDYKTGYLKALDKISDLKAKLAEKSKELQECKIGDKNTQDALFSKIQKLEQQLAENKKLSLLYFGDENTETILTTNKMIQHIKISFCIEQLEKVKKKVEKRNNGVSQATYSDNFKDGYSSCCCDTTYSIDNQIASLKKGVE